MFFSTQLLAKSLVIYSFSCVLLSLFRLPFSSQVSHFALLLIILGFLYLLFFGLRSLLLGNSHLSSLLLCSALICLLFAFRLCCLLSCCLLHFLCSFSSCCLLAG